MASGISNTFRLGGVAVGVALLGAVLEARVGASLSHAGVHGLAGAVSSAGLRAVAGHPGLVQPARTAFVGSLGDLLIIGSAVLVGGTLAAATLMHSPRPEVEAVTEPT
jgi:hypothetical protein